MYCEETLVTVIADVAEGWLYL